MKPRFLVSTKWAAECIREGKIIWTENVENVVTNQGLNRILNTFFHGATQDSNWYIGLFESNTTPSSATTYATPVFTECTLFTEAARVAFTEATATSQSMTNSANKANFTMTTAKTLYGAFLCNATTKGDTAAGDGVIYSAAKFSTAKPVENADVIKIQLTITAADA